MRKHYLLFIPFIFSIIACSQPKPVENTETSQPQVKMDDTVRIKVNGLLGAYNLMVQNDKESFLGLDRIFGAIDSVNIKGGGGRYHLDNLSAKYSFYHSEMRKNDGLVFLMSPWGDLAVLKSNKIIEFFKLYNLIPADQKIQVFNHGFSFYGNEEYIFFTTINPGSQEISLAKFEIKSEKISFHSLAYKSDPNTFRDNFLYLNELSDGKLIISFRNDEKVILFNVASEEFEKIQVDFFSDDKELFKYFENGFGESDKMRTSGYYSQIVSIPNDDTYYRFFVFPQELRNNQQKVNSPIYRKFTILKYNGDFKEFEQIDLADSMFNQISIFKYIVFNDTLYFIPKSEEEDVITLVSLNAGKP